MMARHLNAKVHLDRRSSSFCLLKSTDWRFTWWSLKRRGTSMLATTYLGGIPCIFPVETHRYSKGCTREYHVCVTQTPNVAPLVKSSLYEQGLYICFDPNLWDTVRRFHQNQNC